jgi:hypothetical protein
MMMDMTDKIFAVDDVSLHDLEEHLNEMAQDDWVLHSIHQINMNSPERLPYFTVITHRPYDWEAHAKKRKEEWEAKLKAEEKAAEKWAVTVGTTGGHANE